MLYSLGQGTKANQVMTGHKSTHCAMRMFMLNRVSFACGELCEPVIVPSGFVDPNPRRGCKRNPRTYPEAIRSPSATHDAIASALLLPVHGSNPFPCKTVFSASIERPVGKVEEGAKRGRYLVGHGARVVSARPPVGDKLLSRSSAIFVFSHWLWGSRCSSPPGSNTGGIPRQLCSRHPQGRGVISYKEVFCQ